MPAHAPCTHIFGWAPCPCKAEHDDVRVGGRCERGDDAGAWNLVAKPDVHGVHLVTDQVAGLHLLACQGRLWISLCSRRSRAATPPAPRFSFFHDAHVVAVVLVPPSIAPAVASYLRSRPRRSCRRRV